MKTYRSFLIWTVMAVFLHSGMAGETFAKKPLFEDYKRMIAIDPGHGGDDSGALDHWLRDDADRFLSGGGDDLGALDHISRFDVFGPKKNQILLDVEMQIVRVRH